MRRAAVVLGALLGSLFMLLGYGATNAWAEGEALQGTLRFEGKPVQGVQIQVTTPDDQPVGTGTTNAAGVWRVAVPAPGEYKVSLAEDSLPQGVTLRDPARKTLTVQVFEGNVRSVLFPLGERVAQPSRFDRAPQLLFCL